MIDEECGQDCGNLQTVFLKVTIFAFSPNLLKTFHMVPIPLRHKMKLKMNEKITLNNINLATGLGLCGVLHCCCVQLLLICISLNI